MRALNRSLTVALASLCAIAFLTGCTQDQASDSPYQEAYVTDLESAIESAEAAGASEEQLATLKQHAHSGEPMTYEEYSTAVHATLDCAAEAGIGIDGPRESTQNGQPMLSYGYGGTVVMDDDQLEAIFDECRDRNSTFIEDAYMSGPPALEWIDAQFDTFRPALVACLRQHGEDLPDDATRVELEEHIQALIASQSNYSGPNCIVDSGLNDVLGKLG